MSFKCIGCEGLVEFDGPVPLEDGATALCKHCNSILTVRLVSAKGRPIGDDEELLELFQKREGFLHAMLTDAGVPPLGDVTERLTWLVILSRRLQRVRPYYLLSFSVLMSALFLILLLVLLWR